MAKASGDATPPTLDKRASPRLYRLVWGDEDCGSGARVRVVAS